MPYITDPKNLPPVESIEFAQTPKAAILRPTTHFEIVTADNPDMIRTLKRQQQFIDEGLSNLPDHTSDEDRLKKKTSLIRQFQQPISIQAYKEQLALIAILKREGIPIRKITEDKASLANNEFDYYTDQVFATDAGQYYDKEGSLHFIASSFKNAQRRNEEHLAVAQAENLGATIQILKSKTGSPLTFEGGDIRQMVSRKLFFIGQGHRSDPEAGQQISEISGYTVVPITLLQEQFYHLDCCFLPLPFDAAVIYEGEYENDDNGQHILDSQGWPRIHPGTETMAAESRALIRTLYPPKNLVLLSKLEALAFATNAVILQNPKNERFKMFVNGAALQSSETTALSAHQISYTQAHKDQIMAVTKGGIDIIETAYSTMHGSGGSVRCTVLELACSTDALTPDKGQPFYFSQCLDKLEKRLMQQQKEKRKLAFFQEKQETIRPENSTTPVAP